MKQSIYTDDILWDDYVDAHFDSVLEEELDRVLNSTLAWLTDLVGEQSVGAAFGYEMPQEDEIASAPDPLLIQKILNDQFMRNRFTTDSTRANTYSYLLKTFAFLGTVDRRRGRDRAALENLLNWGDRVRSIPGAAEAAPIFDVVSRAARSRYDLDTGQGTDLDNFVCLLAVARWPIAKSLNKEILDLPKKTVQNLISAKTLMKDSSGNISHQSAVDWISEQFSYDYLFPSADVLGGQLTYSQAAIDHPVFVPQLRCDRTGAVEPFLPDFKTSDGYEIHNGKQLFQTKDYFEALRIFASHPRSRALRSSGPGQIEHGSSTGTFMAVERDRLVSLSESDDNQMDRPMDAEISFPGGVAMSVAETPGISVDPIGHSKKLYRFTSSLWGNLAVEPLKSSVNVYLLDTQRNREAFDQFVSSTTGPGPSGRNSNLNSIAAFKGHSLLVLKMIDQKQASEILKRLRG